MAAAIRSSATSRTALASLCQIYWHPVYAFIRRSGADPDQAQDLAQAFFALLLEKNYLRDARQDRGRFRSFLLTAVKHFLSKQRDRAHAQKRGGGQTELSIDARKMEAWYSPVAVDKVTLERLFELQVCDAVHHAHQRGLIHRDLKPGNILVDASGQPKIVDFGVARLTDLDTQAATQSGAGHLIGTLAYMSPEQVLADPLEIDTRTDVYALGVILYEMLAGRLPYNTSNKLHETLSAIREEDPARLGAISHRFRGDIETIVAKALEKEKARRYESAAELAADIRRYLTDDPIMARPASVGYQLQKFARRHKPLVAGVAVVFVVLVAGIAASTWQAIRANQAERAAVEILGVAK